MDPEYAYPTRTTRLKGGALLVVCTAIWVFAHFYWDDVITPRMSGSACESLPWIQGVAAAFLSMFAVLGVLAARASWLTARSGRSPFPEAWLLFRRPIRRGWRAKADAFTLGAIAFGSFALIGWLWGFLHLSVIFCFTGDCPPC